MGGCVSSELPAGPQGMARVVRIGKPSKCDPTGTGMIVNDILTPWKFEETDPFILLHEFGPVDASNFANMPIGMHPHRGFNEAPYLKQGFWVGTDAWKPNGDPANPMRSGAFQWGFIGCGIEHGVNFDKSYKGQVHGFQLWVNLPAAEKMAPPVFQDAEPEATPLVELAQGARVKVLAGDVAGARSPIDTGNQNVQYLDFMLENGAEVKHNFPDGYTSIFVYVYAGQGIVGTQEVKRHDIMKVAGPGPLAIKATEGEFGLMTLAGMPIGERIVQHGPFVMASKEQIQQTFKDYQSGKFLNEKCKYVLYKADGPVESERRLGQR
eukprot:TRINITY_DN92541_c0_g1_i1.p1 TRINITY_DN92541_c0_g1~~TRINITY_DN92541_c0_g1_i1.p1  ORF type:complete len:340 (+),score=58.34 TRINITY_DN92541_c0_g1_i1:53-1021(+)